MAKKKSSRAPRWRLGFVVVVIAASATGLVGRLVQLQLLDHTRYAAEARAIHVAQETVTGRRGALLDRNGHPLSASRETFDVMVEVKAWKKAEDAEKAAAAIASVTGADPAVMVATVGEASAYEIPVGRGLGYDQAAGVRELGLHGVRLLRTSARLYPEGNLAAQLIGFVGRDNVGLTGLEADLEGIVGSPHGTVTFERDGLGNELALGGRSELSPPPGSDVVLTIDRYVQRVAEKELDKAIKVHKASGGTVIVVKPDTGEVLAMASRPTFDLTKPDLSDESKLALFRNRAITDQYEPGSIFKLITTAAGIDLGLVNPNTLWYDSGAFNADGWTIRNWDKSINGSQTLTQMLSKSLNTGAAWLSDRIGPEQFYDYVSRFGFGQPTASGLGGEVAGSVRTPDSDPNNWRSVDLATNSFGQGISVTPLQMTMAVAALANDGKLMKPMFVKEVVGSDGRRRVSEPDVVREVVSPETARTVLDMMGVVVQGIPHSFLDVQGYTVGGKTGTANVASGGGYKSTYISSFIGVAPLEKPQLLVMVKVDEPKDSPWGTVVAAPVFQQVTQAALAYFRIPPQEQSLVSEVR